MASHDRRIAQLEDAAGICPRCGRGPNDAQSCSAAVLRAALQTATDEEVVVLERFADRLQAHAADTATTPGGIVHEAIREPEYLEWLEQRALAADAGRLNTDHHGE